MNISVSQQERLINALLPQNLKIDDRTEQQMLKFITDISTLFKFYDLQNKPDGDWLDFLIRDFSVLLNYIVCIDFKAYENDYQKIIAGFETATSNETLCNQLQNLFAFTENFLSLFLDLERRLQNIPRPDAVFVAQINDSSVDFQNRQERLLELKKKAEPIFRQYGAAQEKSKAVAEQSARARIENLLPKITRVFHGLQKLYNYLQGLAEYYLNNETAIQGNTEPHIALIKVFLHLYHHLQEKLNELPVSHLDYYYNTILNLKYRAAITDAVHIVAEIIPGSPPIQLKQGMLLDATDAKTQKKYTYRATNDHTLTDATIKELKTLFVSNFLQIKSDDPRYKDVLETQVYKAEQNYIQPASFTEPAQPLITWPVVGEDQHSFSYNERTMDDTDIGFMIASPLLYQKQGRREFAVKIYFDNSSYEQLLDYFKNFAAVSKRSIEEETHDLLKDAFSITYTATKSWETISSHIFKIEQDNYGKGCLTTIIHIHELQKPIDNYQQKVHGYDITTSMPLLRFIVNNNSFHNPYSFLRDLVVEKINIHVSVKGFSLLSLRNNIGVLSTAAPFQVFGAQPLTGSYLEIKNSNVFNKYLKSFDLEFNWLDLPDIPGGFEAYYKGYPDDFKTESFISDIYNINDHKKTAKHAAQLFFDYRDVNGNLFVNKVSRISINKVDTGRFAFINNFPAKEIAVETPGYEQAGIRVELTEPAAAFGHKQFLKILPEIILNNAKKSNTKLPLPNQSYTPLVKSLTVDFVQEQTEYFVNAFNKEPEEYAINFFHIGPLENNLVFPVKQQEAVSLVQNFDHTANLYIGLENLKPEQELNIFFELFQDDFSSTASTQEKVSWYFLLETGWIVLDHKNILEDTTNDLMNSGIVKFRLPCFSKRETGIKPQLQWLQVSANTALKTNVKGIFTQAFLAERVNDPANISAEEMILPSSSISAFINKLPGIKKIWQPFPSFGGLLSESYSLYNTRISEMLWHKNRPLTSDEIARTVLSTFPEILFVKCILPFTAKLELDADLLLLVFPYLNDDTNNNDEPKLSSSKLFRVKQYLQDTYPVFIKPVVLNPVYERVKVCCKIRFNDEEMASPTQLLEKLYTEIKKYLCPWLFQQTDYIITGQKILQNHLLHFIESRPYISYVTSFSLLHFFQEKDDSGEYFSVIKDTALQQQQTADDISITASVPYAILVPSHTHNIEIIETTEIVKPSPTGLSGLEFGNEFSVFYNDDTSEAIVANSQTEDEEMFSLIVDHINL